MKRSLTALAAVSLVVMLTGCGQVQQAAERAVGDGASQVATAAGSEVKKQACSLVSDGLVSVQDKQALAGLVAAGQGAGVPSEITVPLKQIAESGDQVPADSLKALRDACAK